MKQKEKKATPLKSLAKKFSYESIESNGEILVCHACGVQVVMTKT